MNRTKLVKPIVRPSKMSTSSSQSTMTMMEPAVPYTPVVVSASASASVKSTPLVLKSALKKTSLLPAPVTKSVSAPVSTTMASATKSEPITPGLLDAQATSNVINNVPLVAPFKLATVEFIPENEEYLRNAPGDIEISPSGKMLKKYITFDKFGIDLINIYNHFTSVILKRIIQSQELKFEDGSIISFHNIRLIKPSYTDGGVKKKLTPKYALEMGKSYMFEIQLNIIHNDKNVKQINKAEDVFIGSIPAMIKSNMCHIANLSDRELMEYGEDPKDPGGYFIIEDRELLLLNKEILCLNKFLIQKPSTAKDTIKKKTHAHITMTNEIKTKNGGTSYPKITMSNKSEIIKYIFPSINITVKKDKKDKKPTIAKINVLHIFKYYNVDGVQKIKTFIKKEWQEKSMLYLNKNILPARFEDSKEHIIKKIKKKATDKNLQPDEAIAELFKQDLFTHLNDLEGEEGETPSELEARITENKLNMLAIMTARYLEYLAGYQSLDDRDSWSNKRVDVAGKKTALLFRSVWKKKINDIQAKIGNNTFSSIKTSLTDAFLTDTIHNSFKTNSWGLKNEKMQVAILAPLMRDSVVATYSHIKTIDVKTSRSGNSTDIRNVQSSQWGFICAPHTPEGKNCGLVKNLAITVICAPDIDNSIIRKCIQDIKKDIPLSTSPDATSTENVSTSPTTGGGRGVNDTKLMVEAIFIGWCDGKTTKEYLLKQRRNGTFSRYMSIIHENDWLYVDFSVCRLLRPLLIVNPETQKLVYHEKNLIGASNEKLFSEGAVEYISPWEQEYSHIALSVTDIEFRNTELAKIQELTDDLSAASDKAAVESLTETLKKAKTALKKKIAYTHCELDPKATLGVAASLIPWSNHNQAPRTTFAIAMIKQVIGVYHDNHVNRFDGRTKTLCFPTRPMVDTEISDVLGLDVKGSGEMVKLAVMAFEDTEEDAFVINKRFLDLGGFRSYRYSTFRTTIKKDKNYEEKLQKPELADNSDLAKSIYRYIDENGLPYINAPLNEGACVIGKIRINKNTKEMKNDSVFVKVGDHGIVDQVLVVNDGDKLIVKVKVRIMQIPQTGDKFAPRNAQKGTCGRIAADEDMPFMSKDGTTPDIIINPHCMPSRMTMSYPMEILASAGGALLGKRVNGSMFTEFNVQEFRRALQAYGYNKYGNEKMRSGISGKELDAEIFTGPVFFQVLKHQVVDKIQSRERGQTDAISRQPTKGRSKRGGLRFGEMERDTAISHAAAGFLKERLCLVSDPHKTVLCKCGYFAEIGISKETLQNEYQCRMCKNSQDFGKITIPYSYKVLTHYMAALNINLRPQLYESNTENVIDKEPAEDPNYVDINSDDEAGIGSNGSDSDEDGAANDEVANGEDNGDSVNEGEADETVIDDDFDGEDGADEDYGYDDNDDDEY